MRTKKLLCAMTLGLTIALGPGLFAQVETQVPLVVPGAKPVAVEHIKIHGTGAIVNAAAPAANVPENSRRETVFAPPQFLCLLCPF